MELEIDKENVTRRKFECSVYKDEYKTSMIFNLNLSDDEDIISGSLIDKDNNINLSFEGTYVAPLED